MDLIGTVSFLDIVVLVVIGFLSISVCVMYRRIRDLEYEVEYWTTWVRDLYNSRKALRVLMHPEKPKERSCLCF